MTEIYQCTKCGSWNSDTAFRCMTCGHDVRQPYKEPEALPMPEQPIPVPSVKDLALPIDDKRVREIVEEERHARIPGLRFTRQRLESLCHEINPESRHYMEIRVIIGKIDELIDEFEEVKPPEQRFKI